MYLSGIEIIGFKSFAQRVDLKFDSGVTAIVGPNGCGKTNIVDAIRWALGEQRYSTLRSDKMEDVIFNGTKNRKPLGLSEVSLTIQNTKGILPTEYSEVTVTRRVFRSGESEYLLNKVPCRLKDILDLFMDTGMGADAYSVIELKMVETILSDKTDERRRLFEEAAGVTKYKYRRKAAYRKLETVQQDLVRVNDIVKEVQKTVNALERQAKKAEQYNEVSSRLKALEIDLLEREYAELLGRLHPLEERFSLATTEKEKIDSSLREQEEQLDRLRDELQQIEERLIAAQQELASRREQLHKQEERLLVAAERRTSLADNIARYEREKIDLRAQQEKLKQETVQLQAQKEILAREIVALKEKYERAKQEVLVTSREFEEKKAQVQSLNEALLQSAHAILEKRGERERLKARIDNISGRTERLREEVALYTQDIQSCSERVATLTEQDRGLRRQFVEGEMNLADGEKTKKALKQEIDERERAIIQLEHETEQRRQKIKFIQGLIESHEAFSEGAKYLLSTEAWQKKSFITVADAIQTSEVHRIAVETALGDAAYYVIVEKLADVYAAIEELQKSRKGKATLVCLERIPRIRSIGGAKPDRNIIWAKDAVTCKSQFKPLFEFLLDGVAIVESMEEAKSLVGTMTGITCVTLDGQMLSSAGVFTGGSHTKFEGGRIGNQAIVASIEREIADLLAEKQSRETELQGIYERHNAIEVDSLRQSVKAVEKDMTAIEMQIAQVEFEKKRANDAIQRNTIEQEQLEDEAKTHQKDFDAVSAEITALEGKRDATEKETTAATAEAAVRENRFNDATRAANELEIAAVKSQGDLENIGKDLDRNAASLRDIDVTLVRRDEEITHANGEIITLSSTIDTATGEIASLKEAAAAAEQVQKEVSVDYNARRDEVHRIELKIKDERRLHDDAISSVHELELKIADLHSSIEHLRERAKAEFEIELQQKEYAGEDRRDLDQLRDEVRQMKDRIRILGAINFAAFDEFKTESERYTFLSQQRDDLIDAEKSLLSAIDEINTTAQKKFLETFAMIRENFIKTFKELFQEGDVCDLRLQTDEATGFVDPLEAGIEILAQPRGKRPTSIDLLSGGEKTLTAIALLFAIYLVKPSPFCILDEVDAPLDDSNIDRYTRILTKFSDNTQFIVVTHNKRTMEAASALYGITMEEEGVSKVVTVRFNDESRVRSASIASGN
jgi:chromosome segregation protein